MKRQLLLMMMHERKYGLVFSALVSGVVGLLSLVLTINLARSAHATTGAGELMVYAAADESSPLVEAVPDGAVLSPMVEMTGAGGEKWFMVKTPSGNVGWIKAGDQSAAKKVDDHFRAMPKDVGSIDPVVTVPQTSGKFSASGAVVVPIRMRHNQVVVPVTFSNGYTNVTGNLVMDTGATQTTISRRIARELRLFAIESGYSVGIGGMVPGEVALVEVMKVGTIGVKNMRVSILDFSSAPSLEGLLGFDFLKHFQLSVDSEKQVMVLTPRKSDSK